MWRHAKRQQKKRENALKATPPEGLERDMLMSHEATRIGKYISCVKSVITFFLKAKGRSSVPRVLPRRDKGPSSNQ